MAIENSMKASHSQRTEFPVHPKYPVSCEGSHRVKNCVFPDQFAVCKTLAPKPPVVAAVEERGKLRSYLGRAAFAGLGGTIATVGAAAVGGLSAYVPLRLIVDPVTPWPGLNVAIGLTWAALGLSLGVPLVREGYRLARDVLTSKDVP